MSASSGDNPLSPEAICQHVRSTSTAQSSRSPEARGIGKATAKAFSANGSRVAIGDLDTALAEHAASDIGHGTVALALDVTDRASVENFVAQVQERLGPIDVYVNNAGNV
jgi:NAD(P)-dependent dehydrogenase (short-subunit alcohol dehydrogenase family)